MPANIGAAEAFITALLQREPDARLGSRANGGAGAVLTHPWLGLTARQLLTKQAPAPWVPHLNGPGVTVAAPPELVAMADRHAQGTPPSDVASVITDFEAVW